MASSSTTEAQIKSEIARLTASINQHKSLTSRHPGVTRTTSRNNTYINPNYKPTSKSLRPAHNVVRCPTPPSVNPPTEVKDVVLNGVAFESSGRSLVRKDLPKPVSGPINVRPTPPYQQPFTRKSGHLIPASRVYKPKSSRGRHGRPVNRNMTLNNTTRPYPSVFTPPISSSDSTLFRTRRTSSKRLKYSDKPCPRFTTTGACSRGLTCPYQHDPSKIAICWNFLQDNCPNTADSCNLSHDPTPERTPLCLHFLNKGRCTREKCPFPHVNVGARQGVCRDFAVLGYCAKGLDCDKQHVRECPDFAEKGTCSTKGCKLPHVIRANRTRKPPPPPTVIETLSISGSNVIGSISVGTDDVSISEPQESRVTANDTQLGDEYISLTFNESEEESEEEDEDEDEDEDESEDKEGSDPSDVEPEPEQYVSL